ncbi:MAG: four helix bundle protein [Bacteroidota bacterium]|jgi:four helix bundle protein
MATIKNFEDLEIWQKAIDIADQLYDFCMNDQVKKDFSLQDQLKRAAISISNNIAEGFEYNNNADFIKFLRYAKGSCGECRSMIGFMKRRKWISKEDHDEFYTSLKNLGAQIGSFMSYLRKTTTKTRNKQLVISNP